MIYFFCLFFQVRFDVLYTQERKDNFNLVSLFHVTLKVPIPKQFISILITTKYWVRRTIHTTRKHVTTIALNRLSLASLSYAHPKSRVDPQSSTSFLRLLFVC